MRTRSDSHWLWRDGMVAGSGGGRQWRGEGTGCTGGRLICSYNEFGLKPSIGEAVSFTCRPQLGRRIGGLR